MKPHHKGYEKTHRSDRDPRSRESRDSPDDLPPPGRGEKPNRTGLQDYFIDGTGIQRDVLQRQICFMLGNEARSKPSSYKGVQGYLITAVRPFTDKQLEDLMEISEEYLNEKRQYEHDQKKAKKPVAHLPFEKSETSQRHRHPQEQWREYPDRQYPQDSYPVSSPPGQFIDSSYNPQQNPGYPPRQAFPPGPPLAAPGYLPPGPQNPRAFPYDQHAYGDPRAAQRDPYQSYGTPTGGEYMVDPNHTRNIPRYMPPEHAGRGGPPMYPPTSLASLDEPMADAYSPSMDIDQPPYQPRGGGGGYPVQRRMAPDDDEGYYPNPGYKVAPPREEKRRRDDDYHRRPGR